MIAEIRSYIRSGVKSIDSDLIENTSAFYDQDIGETLIGRSFQIEINNINNTSRTEFTEDNLSVVVSIFGFGYVNELAEYDELLDKAICIRDYITNIKNFSGVETIVNVISDSINVEQLPTDNNGFKININLTLSQAYSRG